MKKLRKIIAGLICAVMAFSYILPIYAVEARYPVRRCPQCFEGAVTSHQVNKQGKNELKSGNCPHGGKGLDWYLIFEVTIEDRCDKCTYKTTSSHEERELVYCAKQDTTEI